MQKLLSHPTAKDELAPFVVAMIVAVFCLRMLLSALVVIVRFAKTLYPASDLPPRPVHHFTQNRTNPPRYKLGLHCLDFIPPLTDPSHSQHDGV